MTSPLAGVDVGATVKKLVGFLEEAPGVKSSSRLLATAFAGVAASVVLVMDWYVIYQTMHIRPVDPLVITAFFGVICPLVGGGAVAITKRTEVDKAGAP